MIEYVILKGYFFIFETLLQSEFSVFFYKPPPEKSPHTLPGGFFIAFKTEKVAISAYLSNGKDQQTDFGLNWHDYFNAVFNWLSVKSFLRREMQTESPFDKVRIPPSFFVNEVTCCRLTRWVL